MGSIGIIGAGLSGLVAGRELQRRGHQVVIHEKSRSLCGRCATRLWREHVVDHGAQYFTVTQSDFKQELQSLPPGLLKTIQAEVIDQHGHTIPASGGNRYFYLPGNNRMGKVLSENLEIRQDSPVERLESAGDGWSLNGDRYDVVLVTAPWPQTTLLLNQSAHSDQSQANESYVPCLTAFFEFDGAWTGQSRERYAVSIRDEEVALAWSACENHKAGRVQNGKTVFVVQASESFSRQWLEADPNEYMPHLLHDLKDRWQISELPEATFSHRWRYARKSGAITIPELPRGVYLAGDSCVESKIESVWLDGKRAASEIDEYFKS